MGVTTLLVGWALRVDHTEDVHPRGASLKHLSHSGWWGGGGVVFEAFELAHVLLHQDGKSGLLNRTAEPRQSGAGIAVRKGDSAR